MDEHMRPPKAATGAARGASSGRPYRMQRRAEHVDATRRRIVEATVRLHTTVGPAATSIAAIAEEASVTRLTVYRHFPDLELLFEACNAHWWASSQPPDPSGWTEIGDLEGRARRALGELYAFYRRTGDELYPIFRDRESMPAGAQAAAAEEWAHFADALLSGLAPPKMPGSVTSAAADRRLRAAAGHVVDLMTWRSLAVEQGLPHEEVVELGVRFLCAAPHDPRRSE
jgi:AcrR family transcriptional regulator